MLGQITRLIEHQQFGMIAAEDGQDYAFQSMALRHTKFSDLSLGAAKTPSRIFLCIESFEDREELRHYEELQDAGRDVEQLEGARLPNHARVRVNDVAQRRAVDVRRLLKVHHQVHAALALFSTEPDEPLSGAPARTVRVTIAAIIHQSIWGEAPP